MATLINQHLRPDHSLSLWSFQNVVSASAINLKSIYFTVMYTNTMPNNQNIKHLIKQKHHNNNINCKLYYDHVIRINK